jgi:hypothetical protein
VPDANAGLSAPLDRLKPLKSALLLAATARVTVNVYVFFEVPSSAVTIIVIVFLPTSRLTVPDALPLTTTIPFTVIVDLLSLAVGVIVILLTLFATSAKYFV